MQTALLGGLPMPWAERARSWCGPVKSLRRAPPHSLHDRASGRHYSRKMSERVHDERAPQPAQSGPSIARAPGGRELLASTVPGVMLLQRTAGNRAARGFVRRAAASRRLARRLNDGHDLQSPRFAGDLVLEEAYDGAQAVQRGSDRNAGGQARAGARGLRHRAVGVGCRRHVRRRHGGGGEGVPASDEDHGDGRGGRGDDGRARPRVRRPRDRSPARAGSGLRDHAGAGGTADRVCVRQPHQRPSTGACARCRPRSARRSSRR